MHKYLAKTLFTGKPIISVPSCHSSNDMLTELVRTKKVFEGTVIHCGYQEKGKGQRGSNWESEPNANLTFSILYKPDFLLPSEHFSLNMVVSLGIIDVLDSYIPYGLTVKWPNDIYHQDQKMGGILIENQVQKGGIQNSIIGIGLNINQTKFTMDTATSLRRINGQEFDRMEILYLLLERLEKRYLELRGGKENLLREAYQERLYRRGEIHPFSEPGKPSFGGKINGIDAEGRLLIECNGIVKAFNFKEIVYL